VASKKTYDDADEEISMNKRVTIAAQIASDDSYEDSDCPPGEFMSKLKTKNYTDALDDYAWLKTERHNNLSNINKIVKRLIKKGCTSVET
jgi:hypothetical protein